MGPNDANAYGNVHGGWIMKLCDDVAVVAATRHAGARVVTVALDGMRFRHPVRVNDLLTLRATVNGAWATSMEVGVRVEAENVRTREVFHTCTAYLTLVALGESGAPTAVPPLVAVTAEDRRRWTEANLRREIRLNGPDALRDSPR